MDEPLSALDRKLKQEILPYLEQLHRELDIPVVYVSHAPDEVARLADHVIMLDRGKPLCSGPLKETMLDHRFATLFGDGASTVVEGVISEHTDGLLTTVSSEGLTIRLTPRPMALQSPIRCRIYASDVSVCTSQPIDSSILNIFAGKVARIDAGGQAGESLLTLELAKGQKLLAQISSYSLKRLQLQVNTPVWAQVKSVAVL